jgi:hypothetical protein
MEFQRLTVVLPRLVSRRRVNSFDLTATELGRLARSDRPTAGSAHGRVVYSLDMRPLIDTTACGDPDQSLS